MTVSEAQAVAWEWFAKAHPHEAYAMNPEAFWELFQRLRPGVPREEMERLLRETEVKP